MQHGFIRVASATPSIKIADCIHNGQEILALINEANMENCKLIVFPELCLTGYTCGDLFNQSLLIDSALQQLLHITEETANLDIISIVGLPFAEGSQLYNCGAVIHKGEILGLVPKANVPNYSEFYEARNFTPYNGESKYVSIGKMQVCFGSVIFKCSNFPEFTFGIEICEDLWVPVAKSINLALSGANIICNLSASNEIVGKKDYRTMLVQQHSAQLVCAYIYADAGEGESTTDLVFAGHKIIAENGKILAQSDLFHTGLTYADIDLQLLTQDRRHRNTYNAIEGKMTIYFEISKVLYESLKRDYSNHPFVPKESKVLADRCKDILDIQTAGLKQRLLHTGLKCVVLGISGGLDSTLALLVAVRAFNGLKLPMKGIIGVTMPCFGTTDRTYNNAVSLCHELGITFKEIPILQAVTQHFTDIGHDIDNHDITYENSQARERTQVIMDIANQNSGLVIGTGDLSELALGWATYNGDHMSMYGVNCSIPKTLVRYLVSYYAQISNDKLKNVLNDVLDTPVSPELLPPNEGEISQKTENIVGPYELHDFYLYYMLRFGFEPDKIFRLTKIAFNDCYDDKTILGWLKVFYKRFFAQQFKRSCLPDGPKVGTVSLSPRGDFRMPSDACVKIWLDRIDNIEVNIN